MNGPLKKPRHSLPGSADFFTGKTSRTQSAKFSCCSPSAGARIWRGLLGWAFAVLAGAAAADTVEVRQTSVPVGIVNQTANVPLDSGQQTLTAPSTSGSYTFAYWTLNAVRAEDSSGAAENPANFVASTAVDAVALYFPTAEDTDADGLPDWWEWRYWGDLDQTAAMNLDADDFDNAEEYARGQHPRLPNLHGHGGSSRRRGASFFVDTTGRLPFRQTSDPATILEQADYYVPGTVISAPDKNGHTYSNYKFSWWDLNGSRKEDASGVALSGFSFPLTAPSTATAHYVDPTVDTDSDGIKDWHEWTYYGDLSNDSSSDTDGDGFPYGDEVARSQSPRVADALEHGGTSRRRGPSFYVDTTGRLPFRQTSDPATILEQTDYYPPGTVVSAPDKNGHTYSGYQFSWWDLDGTRKEDASGVALTSFSFALNAPSTATAHYVDPTVDTDSDGIKDWHEWTYYGTLSNDVASDTDSDGFPYSDEVARGQSPRVADVLEHGGSSRRRGPSFFVDTTGRLVLRQLSTPATIIDQTDSYAPGTVVSAPDKNGHTYAGYQFSWWDKNRVRQADASGVALTGFSFPLMENTTLLAHYFDPNADTDGDGIKDWHEWTYYGSLVHGSGSDTDSDGFPYAEEVARSQSPRVADVCEHGGTSRRRGESFILDPDLTATAPVVGVLSATNISTTTATISALVNPMSAATTANFEYGPTTAYGSTVASESILNGFAAEPMSASLSNLQPGTTYSFRVHATNDLGTSVSTAGSFMTLPDLTAVQQWMRIYSLTDFAGDEDGDGVKNLVEYAFGMNPVISGDTWRMPLIELIGDQIRMTVSEPAGAGGIVYGAECSEDLIHWIPLGDSGYGTFHEFWTPANLEGSPQLFVRWVIRLQ